jgi:hypothetical protein
MEGLADGRRDKAKEGVAMTAPDPKQVASGFVDALTISTLLRGRAMRNLDQTHKTLESALSIEASRVAARYGAGSAQSKAIQARITAHAARGRIITAERRRTQLTVPEAEPNAFIVYGQVLNAGGAPLKGVEIVASSETRASVASTYSEANGSFALSVPAAVTVTPGSVEKTRLARTTDAPARVSRTTKPSAKIQSKSAGDKLASAATTPQPVSSFQLILTDSSSSTTLRYPEIFMMKSGAIAYREIAMPSPSE